MLNALIALVATIGALVATGLLVMRAYNQRLPYLVAWSLTSSGLSIGLTAMTIGFMAGFGSMLFRAMELGGALLAPVWLVLGVVELIAYYVQVRFAAWLFAISYSVVAAVIVLLDPLAGRFDKGLPKPGDHYTFLPLTLLSVAHVLVVIGLVACAGVTALRARKNDVEAHAVLLPVAVVTLAGVLVVAGTRGMLPGFVAVVALGAAAGLIWYGATRIEQDYEDTEPFEDEPDPAYAKEYVREQRRRPEPAPEPAMMPAPTAAPPGVPATAPPPGLCGQITVYTLLDGREEAFDRLAAEAVRAARDAEPDTLMYICHEVTNSPTQRIFYQLFRDPAAFKQHRLLPQVQRFAADSRTHVLAMNVVELKVNSAKVPALPSPAPQPQGHRR
ncbi:MAG: Antibiotic biosynthesis monooxygenase [Streptosporangiaceae bacterium]|nr:Antibiotic biosynthesis monooxygenase [Streptosporangiaceae bacterium]